MNTEIVMSTNKGEEKIELILTPANNLEREFFNTLFNNNGVKVEQVPNSDDIVIKKTINNATVQESATRNSGGQ